MYQTTWSREMVLFTRLIPVIKTGGPQSWYQSHTTVGKDQKAPHPLFLSWTRKKFPFWNTFKNKNAMFTKLYTIFILLLTISFTKQVLLSTDFGFFLNLDGRSGFTRYLRDGRTPLKGIRHWAASVDEASAVPQISDLPSETVWICLGGSGRGSHTSSFRVRLQLSDTPPSRLTRDRDAGCSPGGLPPT